MWCTCAGNTDDEGSSSEEDTQRDKKKPKGEMCGLVFFYHLCLECNFLQSMANQKMQSPPDGLS